MSRGARGDGKLVKKQQILVFWNEIFFLNAPGMLECPSYISPYNTYLHRRIYVEKSSRTGCLRGTLGHAVSVI